MRPLSAFDSESPPSLAALSRKRLVVAVEDPSTLESFAGALRGDGHSVLEASNGFQLMHWIEVMTQWRDPLPLIHLVVTDLRMPLFSGLECLEQLRRRGSSAPVILLAGSPDDTTRRRAQAFGAFAILDKPVDALDLRSTVGRALAR